MLLVVPMMLYAARGAGCCMWHFMAHHNFPIYLTAADLQECLSGYQAMGVQLGTWHDHHHHHQQQQQQQHI
jgi:hypothetical protein